MRSDNAGALFVLGALVMTVGRLLLRVLLEAARLPGEAWGNIGGVKLGKRHWICTNMKQAQQHLPTDYTIRLMRDSDQAEISAICATVYPTERPYTQEELRAHHQLFPDGQFVVEHTPSGAVAGAHFTLMVNMLHFHVDDSWDTLTAGGSFADHDPTGHTLYGADLFVHPGHQHHGLGRALTEATRGLVREKGLWRMVGGSRMPGYGGVAGTVNPDDYIMRVKRAEISDPVLTAHLHDGWDAITAIRGYLPHDEESAGWAAVIQWLNPASPPPPDFDLSRVPRKA